MYSFNDSPLSTPIFLRNASTLRTGSSKVADNWGTSYYAQKQGQTVNPDASKNLQPVEGLYGQAAEAAMGQYLKSFSGKAGQGQSSTTGTLGIGYMGQK